MTEALTLAPQMIDDRYWGYDIERVCERYDASYVGELPAREAHLDFTYPMAVFFRPEPHPEFGNRYFGLFQHRPVLDPDCPSIPMICNADRVEEMKITAVLTPEGIVYSTHRHDYRTVDGGAIDGGIDAANRNGTITMPIIDVVVRDGKFIAAESPA